MAPPHDDPPGQDIPAHGTAGGRVRVLVGGDVDALGAGRLDHLQELRAAAPERSVGLQMRVLEPGARAPSRLDQLLGGHEQPGALGGRVPDVRRVELPTPGCNLHQRDHLGVQGVDPRGHREARRQAHGAGVQRLGHQGLHPLDLPRIGRPRLHAQHRLPHGPVAYLSGDVQRGAVGPQGVEVAAEVRPRRLPVGLEPGAPRVQVFSREADQGGAQGESAVAYVLQRDPLAYLAVGGPIDEEVEVRVAVEVDEPGRHHQT